MNPRLTPKLIPDWPKMEPRLIPELQIPSKLCKGCSKPAFAHAHPRPWSNELSGQFLAPKMPKNCLKIAPRRCVVDPPIGVETIFEGQSPQPWFHCLRYRFGTDFGLILGRFGVAPEPQNPSKLFKGCSKSYFAHIHPRRRWKRFLVDLGSI